MREDPDADALEEVADRLEEHGDEVQKRIDHARSDWHSKQADQSIPGAVEGPDDQQEEDEDG